MNEEIEDIEILALFKDESTKEKGFKLLLKKYQKRIYWHIRKILVSHDDTDDVTQNTFVKVYYSLDGFREESKLYTWIYRIATNQTIFQLE